MTKLTDIETNDDFPPCPIVASERLTPITSWSEMYRETQTTGVVFEEFWDESVNEGVAYFFRWLGNPRSTVLVVWNDEGPTHIEARTHGDALVLEKVAKQITKEVFRLFRKAGYWSNQVAH